jgi:undecaprenyl-phosphate 4-deoxy-4-formamido-L-arabinose transferase
MSDRILLSVVIPVFNEEENLDELIRRCLLACDQTGGRFEIVLVNDGSSDGSAEKIDPRLVDAMDKGYDVVGTVRLQRQDTLFRRVASAIINKAVQKSTGVMMHDYGCMLRAYRRHIVEAMLMCREHSTFIPILANSFARTTTEIDVKHEARKQGQSKYSLMKLVMLHFDLLTSMTTFPLRLLSILGGIVSSAGIGFGLFLLLMRIYYGAEWAAQGVFTLFAILFIFVGAQFIAMGLLGEYIGRIYHDVRARPRYFVQRVSGDSNINSETNTKGQK